MSRGFIGRNTVSYNVIGQVPISRLSVSLSIRRKWRDLPFEQPVVLQTYAQLNQIKLVKWAKGQMPLGRVAKLVVNLLAHPFPSTVH